jgi:hypothetical protein
LGGIPDLKFVDARTAERVRKVMQNLVAFRLDAGRWPANLAELRSRSGTGRINLEDNDVHGMEGKADEAGAFVLDVTPDIQVRLNLIDDASRSKPETSR